MKLIKISENKR